MSEHHEYILRENYLELRVSGNYDFNLAIDRLRALLKKAKDKKQQKILVDYRELTGLEQSIEKVLYSLKADEIYSTYINRRGLPLRIAYLTRSMVHEPAADIGRRISGLEFEVFDSKDDAISWLLFNI